MFNKTKAASAATTTTAMLCIDPFCESHGKHSHTVTLDLVSEADVVSDRALQPSAAVRLETAALNRASVASEVAQWRSDERKARSLAARREASERAHSELHEHANSMMRRLDVQAQVVEELTRRLDAERAWERELERITYTAQSAADKALAKVVRLHG